MMGCGEFLLGKTECLGTLLEVRGGYGVRIVGSPSTDTAQEENGVELALGFNGPRWRAMRV